MQPALDQFNQNLTAVQNTHGLYLALQRMATGALDLSDILRSEIVLAVSAFDHLIRQVVIFGSLEIHDGARPTTPSYLAEYRALLRKTQRQRSSIRRRYFEDSLRHRYSTLTFQRPFRIDPAIAIVSLQNIWVAAEYNLGLPSQDLKAQLNVIVDRRNRISHEGDFDPSFPGLRWPISAGLVEESTGFLSALGNSVVSTIRL